MTNDMEPHFTDNLNKPFNSSFNVYKFSISPFYTNKNLIFRNLIFKNIYDYIGRLFFNLSYKMINALQRRHI